MLENNDKFFGRGLVGQQIRETCSRKILLGVLLCVIADRPTRKEEEEEANHHILNDNFQQRVYKTQVLPTGLLEILNI